MDNIVTIENMSKRFGKKEVFKELSLAFPANRVVGLLGENGIGKTTLLRLIADILKPNAGEIKVSDVVVSRKTRDKVSFMLDPLSFYNYMRVEDAIEYYVDFFPDFDVGKAKRLCEEFNLDPKEKIRKLSKGNKERVCFLLCLSRSVPLYLLDEPIAGFDPKFKHETIRAMLTHTGEEQTVIISSHLLRDLESVFDEIVILKKDSVITANTDDIRAGGKSVEEFYLEAVG